MKEKSGVIYNLVKKLISCLSHLNFCLFNENPGRIIYTELTFIYLEAHITKSCTFLSSVEIF